MPRHRPPLLPSGLASPDLTLLYIGPGSTHPVSLEVGRRLVIRGAHGDEVTVFAAGEGTVAVRPAHGTSVWVNDVQVRESGRARAGDLIALADRSVLVQRVSVARPAPTNASDHAAFLQRISEEVDYAQHRRTALSLLVVRSPLLVGESQAGFLASAISFAREHDLRPVATGQLARGTVELLCPGMTVVMAAQFREYLSEALGMSGAPFRWGWASLPTEAFSAATLLGRALDRLFSDQPEPVEDFPRADPVMARLWSLCDLWAGRPGGILMEGEEGSGRETLARAIHERRASPAHFVVATSATFDEAEWRATIERARGGTLYVRHLDALPMSEISSFWKATGFRPMAAVKERLLTPHPPTILSVPALRDRPSDIIPIAEHIVARAVIIGRGGAKLTPPARVPLIRGPWNAGVRELKNVLRRAVLIVDESAEILPEHLEDRPAHLPRTGAPGETDLRAHVRSFEKQSLLEAIERSDWNVSEAARLMGIPRRTVVHRMRKLRLTRPRRR
jgi:hypothetical protein